MKENNKTTALKSIAETLVIKRSALWKRTNNNSCGTHVFSVGLAR